MFENWCEQTADLVRYQINKRDTRVQLFIATDSEENYTYLLEGTLKISISKEFGYDFYYLEIYEDFAKFMSNGLSVCQIHPESSVLEEENTKAYQQDTRQFKHPPIIKKMILPQCLFQVSLTQLKIYFLESQSNSRTAMLGFQSQEETEIYWKFICWVLMRQKNPQVDPLRALYLPNEKNLSFIMRNFQPMKGRIFEDLKSNGHRFLQALGRTIDKCTQVGDYHNLDITHDLVKKIFYCDDNTLIESFFRNDSSFKIIIGSFSKKRCQDLYSCYWDPILPLPLERECQLSTLISQDYLLVVPPQVRQSICIIHRITYFREFILQIKKKLTFESKLMEIVKYNSSLLIKYFTNAEIVKDLLIYDEEKWGLWKSNMSLRNDETVQSRSDVFNTFSLDEGRESLKYQSQWDRISVNSSFSAKNNQNNYMDLEEEEKEEENNLNKLQCIEIEDDSSSCCQIIEKKSKENKKIVEISLTNQPKENPQSYKKTTIQNCDQQVKGLSIEHLKQNYIQEQLSQSRLRLMKSLKPLLFWLIITFAKSIQQPLVKQESISSLFHSDLLKYVFIKLNKSLDEVEKSQLKPQSQFNTSYSENSHPSLIAPTSYLLINTQLLLQILISMAKYNHKKMIIYLNHYSRKAQISVSESSIDTSNIRKMIMQERKKQKQRKRSKHRQLNPYKILALSYWKYLPPKLNTKNTEEHKKVIIFFENLFPQIGTEIYIQPFLDQFVSNCLSNSMKFFTLQKIKQESSQTNEQSKKVEQIPFRQARRRQLELCMFVMKNIGFSRYNSFINGVLFRFVFPTFSVIEDEFENYSKDEKLLLMQFVNKLIDWVQFTKKQRQKHQRKENFSLMGHDEEQYSDFNIPNNQINFINQINNIRAPPLIGFPITENMNPQMNEVDLMMLQQSVFQLEEELVRHRLIWFVYSILLQQLRRKRENCIVGCGLQIMKKIKGLLIRPKSGTSGLNIGRGYVSNLNSQYNNINEGRNRFNQGMSLYRSMASPLSRPNREGASPIIDPSTLSPILCFMFSILQNYPDWLTLYIEQLPLKYRQLFLTFYFNKKLSAQSLSLSSSDVSSSSVDYSQSNDSEQSNEYDNAFYRYQDGSSGNNSSGGFSNQSYEEIAKRNHQFQGILDEMYNRREEESSDDEDDEDDNSPQTEGQQKNRKNQFPQQQPFSSESESSSSSPTSSPSSQETIDIKAILAQRRKKKSNKEKKKNTPWKNDSSSSDEEDNEEEYSSQAIEQLFKKNEQKLHKMVQSYDMESVNRLIQLFDAKETQKNTNNHHNQIKQIQKQNSQHQNYRQSLQTSESPKQNTGQQSLISDRLNGQKLSREEKESGQCRQNFIQQQAQTPKYQLQSQEQNDLENDKQPYRTYYHESSQKNLKKTQNQTNIQNQFGASKLESEKKSQFFKHEFKTPIERQTIAEQQMTLEAFTSFQATIISHSHLIQNGLSSNLNYSSSQQSPLNDKLLKQNGGNRIIYKVVNDSNYPFTDAFEQKDTSNKAIQPVDQDLKNKSRNYDECQIQNTCITLQNHSITRIQTPLQSSIFNKKSVSSGSHSLDTVYRQQEESKIQDTKIQSHEKTTTNGIHKQNF